MAEIPAQIAQEMRELEAVPKVPIAQFMGGPAMRCHLCGQVWPANQLKVFDTHIQSQGADQRQACPNCHPERGNG